MRIAPARCRRFRCTRGSAVTSARFAPTASSGFSRTSVQTAAVVSRHARSVRRTTGRATITSARILRVPGSGIGPWTPRRTHSLRRRSGNCLPSAADCTAFLLRCPSARHARDSASPLSPQLQEQAWQRNWTRPSSANSTSRGSLTADHRSRRTEARPERPAQGLRTRLEGPRQRRGGTRDCAQRVARTGQELTDVANPPPPLCHSGPGPPRSFQSASGRCPAIRFVRVTATRAIISGHPPSNPDGSIAGPLGK